uniref:Ig-like domain-containing protein n=1 Tax=Pavo cristatus TaxID=9049 RepID=A0A8C9FKY8_PAVCR
MFGVFLVTKPAWPLACSLSGSALRSLLPPSIQKRLASKNTGQTETLQCTYSSSASYIYVAWYWQLPNRPLQYLLQSKGRGGSYNHTAPFAHLRFSSQADKSSGTPVISGLELEDSALYFCTFYPKRQRTSL